MRGLTVAKLPRLFQPFLLLSASFSDIREARPSASSSRERDRLSRPLATGILVAILLLAAVLRLWALGFGLPGQYNPDENFLVLHALRFGTGDLNPHWFLYPTLWMYCLFGLYGGYFLAGLAIGRFEAPFDLSVEYFTDPTLIFFLGRLASALSGVGVVALTYLLGAGLFGRRVGLLGAAFVAIEPFSIESSHYIKVDVPTALFVMVSLLASARVLRGGGTRWYLAAGLFAGLAASTKYPGGMVALALPLAHLLRQERRQVRDLLLGLALAPAGFLLGTPFALVEIPSVVANLRGHLEQASVGWPGGTGPWVPYLGVVTDILGPALGLPLLLLICVGVVLVAVRRDRGGILLACFGGAYFVAAGGSPLNFGPYWVPFLPSLLLLAGKAVDEIARAATGRLRPGIWALLLVTGLWVLAAVGPTAQAVRLDQGLARTHVGEVVTAWIEENLPAGTRIVAPKMGLPLAQTLEVVAFQRAMELSDAYRDSAARAYKTTPTETSASKAAFYDIQLQMPVREPAYFVIVVTGAATMPLEFYLQNGFEYLLVPVGEREFFRPLRSAELEMFYDTLEREHTLVRTFQAEPGTKGPSLHLYKLRRPTPGSP